MHCHPCSLLNGSALKMGWNGNDKVPQPLEGTIIVKQTKNHVKQPKNYHVDQCHFNVMLIKEIFVKWFIWMLNFFLKIIYFHKLSFGFNKKKKNLNTPKSIL
jgi:hypothetical protein